MTKKFMKTVAVLLAALVLLSALPFTASAAVATQDSVGVRSGTTGDCTWTFDEDTGTLTISGNGRMADYNKYEKTEYYDYNQYNVSVYNWDVYEWKFFYIPMRLGLNMI